LFILDLFIFCCWFVITLKVSSLIIVDCACVVIDLSVSQELLADFNWVSDLCAFVSSRGVNFIRLIDWGFFISLTCCVWCKILNSCSLSLLWTL
jgi:hypothetical protein